MYRLDPAPTGPDYKKMGENCNFLTNSINFEVEL